jgi:hypothetical protein
MQNNYTTYPCFTRVKDPVELEEIRMDTKEGQWSLFSHEMWWRDHTKVLDGHGYIL